MNMQQNAFSVQPEPPVRGNAEYWQNGTFAMPTAPTQAYATYAAEPQVAEPQIAEPQVAEPQVAEAPAFQGEALAAVPQMAPYMPDAPYVQVPAFVQAAQQVEHTSDRFSKVSSALVVLGLALVGGAIAPLLSYFNVMPQVKYFVGLAYLCIACLTVAWLAGRLFVHSENRYRLIRATRVAVLMASEFILLPLTAACRPFELRWEITVVFLVALLLVLRFALNFNARWRAYVPLRVNEILVMLVVVPIIAFEGTLGGNGVISTACFAAALVLAGVLVAVRATELKDDQAHPSARNGGLLASTAVALTLMAAAFVQGCTPWSGTVYAYDAVFMVSALACSGIGFGLNSPALRRTGLVIALATVLKMVLLDTLAFDPLPKAIAYLVGGAVCFGIGAMYSLAVKRLAEKAALQDEGCDIQ